MKTGYVAALAISGLLGLAGPARAQNAYVGASLMGEIVRTSHSESGVFDSATGSGEAVGFALRVGTALGSNWGVELEYARPSVIKNRRDSVYPLSALPLTAEQQAALFAPVGGSPTIYPPIYPIPLELETRDRHSTVSALVWANQNISDRASLVYLGGVAFNRFDREYGYGFDVPVILLGTSRTIRYSAHPIVGFESWIGLTDQVTLMPGVRLLGVDGGWSIRPAIGIGWSF